MGGKQIRTGKLLLFLVAGLIVFLSGGCATMERIWQQINSGGPSTGLPVPSPEVSGAAEEQKKEKAATVHLLEGKKLFVQGNYERALREHLRVIALMNNHPPVDEAYFFMGLIHADQGNPKKDYGQSLYFMNRLIKEFPESLFSRPAKSWIRVLQDNERLVRENEKWIKNNEKGFKDQEKILKENEKLVKDHERLIKENEKLTRMLEEYKQVDIDIEGKKRDKGR
ncbi:MAG: outer membrane protein assembly factor BamD [Deltaproteobacteria bacterium]|nr:outer membrane protein assembly factor BamD [Deltaproteobacteria bacterium]